MRSSLSFYSRLLTIFVTGLTICNFAFAQTAEKEAPVAWRPVVDNAKCAAAIAWAVPTLLGVGIAQATAVVSDIGASLLEGKVCFTATKGTAELTIPLLTSLIELGCVAPIEDIRNPKYFTYPNITKNSDSGSSIRLFTCDLGQSKQ